MQLGQKGTSLIQSYETFQPKAYKAVKTEQYYTWGWGHYGPDVPVNGTISRADADKLFAKDVAKFVKGVNAVLTRPVTQNQFDAMVSLAFNIGLGNFQSSTLLKKFNAGDIQGAANEFPRWNKSSGEVLDGLTKRRAAEKALFLS